MAEKSIPQLPELTDLEPGHIIVVDTGTQTFKTTLGNIAKTPESFKTRRLLFPGEGFTVPAGVTSLRVKGIENQFFNPDRQGTTSIGAVFFNEDHEGNLYGWGSHIADGTTSVRSEPTLVGGGGLRVRAINKSFDAIYAETDDGGILAWGNGARGAVGDRTTVSKSTPVMVTGLLNDASFPVFTSGRLVDCNQSMHAGVQDASGMLWAWGEGNFGAIGDNAAVNRSYPVLVKGDQGFGFVFPLRFKAVKLLNSTSFAISHAHDLYAWGVNNTGNLGTGSVTTASVPALVTGGHKFVRIGPGSGASNSALKADGSMYMWGTNSSGQLGDGTAANRSSPTQVIGGHVFEYAVLGSAIAGLKADGTVWTWGLNNQGMCGDGTTDNRSSPVAVIGGKTFKLIIPAQGAFIALDTNGQVWGWGQGSNGRLGHGSTSHASSPTAVLGDHVFEDLTVANGSTVIGLKSNGEMWAWGANPGDGTDQQRSSPVLVAGGINWTPRERMNPVITIEVTPGQTLRYSWLFNSFAGIKFSNYVNRVEIKW